MKNRPIAGGRVLTAGEGIDAGPATAITRLTEVIAQLRENCAWMAQLTHESLVEYLIEESYELVEAIEGGHPDAELRGELGDVLLQVVLHARLAEESGRFDLGEVAVSLTEKMIRRNEHVFSPDGTLRADIPASVEEVIARWQRAKRAERPERTSPFAGIPASLPALALAAKSIKRAAMADQGAPSVVVQGAPRRAETGAATLPTDEAGLGELLLGLVQHAGVHGLDAERALRAAVVRFQNDCAAPPTGSGAPASSAPGVTHATENSN